MNVLITGSRAPVALELARRFQQDGHRVFQADSLPAGIAMRSNAVTRSEIVPRPVEDLQAYIDAIGRIIASAQIDLLVPTCEEVFFLAARADQIHCRMFLADFDLLARIHNKWEFSQFAGNSFATVPQTVLIHDTQRFLDEHDPQNFVFKPVYSRFASRTLVSPDATDIQTLDVSSEQWIAQQRIHGAEYSTYSVATNGRLRAHCTYQSLYRVGTGSGICFRPVNLADVESFVSEFVRTHGYTGQIGFDFMRGKDGRLWVIEGNPRATSGAQLFAKADPLAEIFAKNDDSEMLRPSTDELAMIEFAMPLWGLADATRRGQLLPFLHDLARSRWLCFSWRDPWPALGMPASFWPLISIAWRRGCSLQQASTFDVEWNGEEL